MGASERELKKLIPGANVRAGLPITGSNAAGSEGALRRWLAANGLM